MGLQNYRGRHTASDAGSDRDDTSDGRSSGKDGEQFFLLKLAGWFFAKSKSRSCSVMSPWHLWALLLALLGVWQASAVRTVTSPSTCSYKQLGGASVKELDGGGVKVRVCGEEVVLRTSSAQEDAWKAVSWWDPSSQGKQLSDHDLKILQDYLGNYHFSRPVGQLGHGLLPSNFEGFAEEENQRLV